MRITGLALVLLAAPGLTGVRSVAAEAAPEFGQPVLVMIGRNPWAMVIGAESASFVLYDNRRALFVAKNEGQPERRKATLSVKDYSAFLAAAVNVDELDQVKDYTALTEWTDQITTELIYRNGAGKLRRVAVYGSFDESGRPNGALSPAAAGGKSEVSAQVPAALLRAFRAMGNFSAAGERWRPPFIEVMIWDYHYAPDENLPWPEKWPGLNDPRTKKTGGEYNGHSLFLRSTEEEALIGFLKSRRERQAVLIDGKKWAISFRRPLPREEEWQRLPVSN